jgi:hypothetical protein
MSPVDIPYCPKCRGSPTTGQQPITARDRDRLKGSLRHFVELRFYIAYRCSACRACYSFQDGFSFFLGYIPRTTFVASSDSSPAPNPFKPRVKR